MNRRRAQGNSMGVQRRYKRFAAISSAKSFDASARPAAVIVVSKIVSPRSIKLRMSGSAARVSPKLTACTQIVSGGTGDPPPNLSRKFVIYKDSERLRYHRYKIINGKAKCQRIDQRLKTRRSDRRLGNIRSSPVDDPTSGLERS